MNRRAVAILFVIATAIVVAALVFHPQAEGANTPRVPSGPDVVLERLATGASDPRVRELASLRRALAADPMNLEVAVRLARLDI